MNQMRLWASAAIIAGVVLLAFMFSVPHTRDLKVVEAPVKPDVPFVTVHDSFKKGTHTLSGSLVAPNACAEVSSVASVRGDASSTSSILIAMTLTLDTSLCLQVPTKISFQNILAAPADLPISVTVNGVVASTTAYFSLSC